MEKWITIALAVLLGIVGILLMPKKAPLSQDAEAFSIVAPVSPIISSPSSSSSKPSEVSSEVASGTSVPSTSVKKPSSKAVVASPLPSVLGSGKVLDSRDTPLDAQGHFKRTQLLETDFKYPYLRAEAEMEKDVNSGQVRMFSQVSSVADHVLVQLNGSPETLTPLLNRYGVEILRKIPNQPIYMLQIPEVSLDALPLFIQKLKQETGVLRSAEPDYIGSTNQIPNDPGYQGGFLWGMRNEGQTGGTSGADIHVTKAWARGTGSRAVVVGIIDTGIDRTHPDLEANIWKNPGETGLDANGHNKATNGIDDDGDGYVDDLYGWDFYENTSDSMDLQGHGTHCAGVIGAVGNNKIGVTGICWQVSLAPLKVFGPDGTAALSDIVEAIYYANQHGISITSNSYGGGGYSQTMKDAIEAAGAKGYLFVTAAGNEGKNIDQFPQYPAAYKCNNMIVVAATDSKDQLSKWSPPHALKFAASNYGIYTVDIAAPGSEICSTYLQHKYASASGTSMACPHVAGACALLKSHDLNLTAAQLKNFILRGADLLSSLQGKTNSDGRLNVDQSVRLLEKNGN